MQEIFWNSIAEYNAATWYWQIAITAVAAALALVLWFRPSKRAKIASKVFMVLLSVWTAFVYYLGFCSARDYSSALAIFWCLVAASWVYDLATDFSSFRKSGKYGILGLCMLVLPLFFPVVSIARGLEFPQIATPVLPSAVALYMLGMLMTFNSKINFFAFILILHWAVIAVSKVEIFDIPEDLLLAAACVPAAVIFLTRALKSAGQDTKPKIFRS